MSMTILPEAYGITNNNILTGDGISNPNSNLTATAGASGSITGTYYYTVSYITTKGETGPWPGTGSSVTVSAKQIELTNIPIGPVDVLARKIYRTPDQTAPVDPKDYRLLTIINDNTTTTYTDNTTDGSLGVPAHWDFTNEGQLIGPDGKAVLSAIGQNTYLGEGAFGNGTPGYASVAIGYQALYNNTTGRRNVAVGQYSLTSQTTGFENTALGTHAGQFLVAGALNTFLGCYAGFNSNGTAIGNVAVGNSALNATASGTGNQNTAVGYRALGNINTADSCLGIGTHAGRYANASRQVFIDNIDRTNITNAQNIGLIYALTQATAIAQILHLNALTRVGPPSITVSQLPAASAANQGYRGYVTDANATTFGSIVAGGGSNCVPVFSTGTAWIIA